MGPYGLKVVNGPPFFKKKIKIFDWVPAWHQQQNRSWDPMEKVLNL